MSRFLRTAPAVRGSAARGSRRLACRTWFSAWHEACFCRASSAIRKLERGEPQLPSESLAAWIQTIAVHTHPTANRDDAEPTNNWMSPAEAEQRVWPLFAGCVQGRTMYVVPYIMGPVDSPHSRAGVQLTDSPYVVASVRIMTRMGRAALAKLASGLAGDLLAARSA
jgi:hypothetical protein